MGQGNFPGPRVAAASDQGGGRGGVVGRPVGALVEQVSRARLLQGMNGCHFQSLFRMQRRHQPRQARGQHAFAGTGRATEQNLVTY